MVSYVVTGAGRGIGLAIVQVLHERNSEDRIFAIVRNPDSSTELKKLADDPNVYIVVGDLDKLETLRSAAMEVSKITGGSLDVFINNAALIPEPLQARAQYTLTEYNGEDDLLIQDFNTFYKTNVIGAVAVTNAFLPLIEEGTLKKVINISSAVGDSEFVEKTGFIGAVAYGVSKAALNHVNTRYTVERRGQGYTFLAISPGFVATRSVEDHLGTKPWNNLINMFKSGYPDWDGAALQPRQSAELVLNVIDKATPEDSGRSISQYGDKRWL